MQQHLKLIENKIGNLDFAFLNKIQPHLSCRNPYFLVCLNEVIYEMSNNTSNMSDVIKNLSMDNLLSYLNKKAEYLYLNSNISEYLKTEILERHGRA